MSLFAFRRNAVAVTVAVWVGSVGSRSVIVTVLVVLTTVVAGGPVNEVDVLVRVRVTKTVGRPTAGGCAQFPPAHSILPTGQQSGCPAAERQQVRPFGQV